MHTHKDINRRDSFMNLQHTFALKRRDLIRSNRDALFVMGAVTLIFVSITVLVAIALAGLSLGLWKILVIIGLLSLIFTDLSCIVLWILGFREGQGEIRRLDEIKRREHAFVDEEKSLQRYYTALIVSYIAGDMLHPRIIVGDEDFYAQQDASKFYSLYPIWKQLLKHGYRQGPAVIYECSSANFYGIVVSGSDVSLYYADMSTDTIYRTQLHTDTPAAEKLICDFYENTDISSPLSDYETFAYHFRDHTAREFQDFLKSHS